MISSAKSWFPIFFEGGGDVYSKPGLHLERASLLVLLSTRFKDQHGIFFPFQGKATDGAVDVSGIDLVT